MAKYKQRTIDSPENWNLITSIVFYRLPRIVPDIPPYEEEYFNLKFKIDNEVFKKTTEGYKEDLEFDIPKIPIVPGPRKTIADNTNDTKSLNRQLDQYLFLIVKKNRKDHAWQFPQRVVTQPKPIPPQSNPTDKPIPSTTGSPSTLNTPDIPVLNKPPKLSMRKQAEETLKEKCGGNLSVYFGSNMPCAHIFYEYPPEIKQQYKKEGGMTFFYKSEYISGDIQLGANLVDYKWVTKAELKEYLASSFYDAIFDALQPMLPIHTGLEKDGK